MLLVSSLLLAVALPPRLPGRWRAAEAVAWAGVPLAAVTTLGGPALVSIVAVLATTLGAIIVRYTRRYLNGHPRHDDAARGTLAVLATTTALVAADDLLGVAVAWTATSVALHGLLTLPDRVASTRAAHEKFLVSRLADVALYAAVAWVYAAIGTTRLDAVAAAGEAVAAPMALLAVAFVMRTAQLPFHGWLLRVMEAPTPVSALLHAGVVNIGGYVLLRLGPALAEAEVARWVLVIAGVASAVVGGWSHLAQPTVKGALAWSTVAQLGFMGIELGIGAYDLALLHLVAHAAYKAHGFLSAGRVVERRAAARSTPSPEAWARAVVVAAALASAAHVLVGLGDGVRGWAAASLLTLALAPRLTAPRVAPVAQAASLVALFTILHAVFAAIAPNAPAPTAGDPLRLAVVVGAFATSFAADVAVRAAPTGSLARAVDGLAYGGLALDAFVTRVGFAVWPPSRTPEPRPLERAA